MDIDDGEQQSYRWESGMTRAWEQDVKEDENGFLVLKDGDELARSRR